MAPCLIYCLWVLLASMLELCKLCCDSHPPRQAVQQCVRHITPRSHLLTTSPQPVPLHFLDQPLPDNTRLLSHQSHASQPHPAHLEPDILLVTVLSSPKRHQMHEILHFACMVTPAQQLQGLPKTGGELL